MGGNDLVDSMRLPTWVELRARDLVPQSGNRLAIDVMRRRTADYFSAMIGPIPDRDDFQGHHTPPLFRDRVKVAYASIERVYVASWHSPNHSGDTSAAAAVRRVRQQPVLFQRSMLIADGAAGVIKTVVADAGADLMTVDMVA